MLIPKRRLRRKQSNLRSAVTRTTQSSQGLAPPPRSAMEEIGSQAQQPIPDVVPELRTWQQGVRTYNRMVNNDVSTDLSLRSAKIPVQNATFYLQPFSKDPLDIEVGQFCEANLFSANGISSPFRLVIDEILHMCEYGFSVLEEVWELREWSPDRGGANRKKYTMLKKLAPRPALSIIKFNYDQNGGPKSVRQQVITDVETGKTVEKEIDIDKLIVFTMNKNGGALEGRSVLRAAYKHWFYKDSLYKIDAIQKERHGIGIPDIELQPGYTDKDFQLATSLAANLRTNEKSYIVRPPGMQVGFAKPEGMLVDVLASAIHHDNQIMKNIFVQFLNLGLEAGGGRATASSQVDMFFKALRYLANLICDYINLYLIPRLVTFNYPTDRFPVLKVSRLGEKRDMQMFAASMANLTTGNNPPLTMDEETENWIREEMDMPLLKGDRNPVQSAAQNTLSMLGQDQQPPQPPGNGSPNKGKQLDTIRTGNVGAPPNAPQ